MGNTRRIPNTDSESEVRSAFQRLDSDVEILEDSTMSVDVIAAVGSLIVKDSDTAVKSYTEFSQGTDNQVLVSAGVGVIPVWTTDLDGLTLLTVDNITINGAVITSDTGAISFGNENLTTTGNVTSADLTASGTITDGTASLISGSLTAVKLGTLTTNGFVKTSAGDGTLSIDTSIYLTAEADTLDTVADRGSTTNQTLTAGGFITGTLTLAAGSITDSSAAISFGNENLSTSGTLAAGATTITGAISATTTVTGTNIPSPSVAAKILTSTGAGTATWQDPAPEADTLDTVSDRGATTDQTLVAGGFTTTGVVTVGAAADMVITVGSITSVSGAISFGNETLSTTGKIAVGSASTYNHSHLDVTGVYAADKYGSQLHLHTTNNTYGLFAGSWASGFALIVSGAHYYAGGNWRARATSASGIYFADSTFSVYTDSGLTDGVVYTPTQRLLVNNSGVTISSDLVFATGSITSVSGAISFGNETLSTTGKIAVGSASTYNHSHLDVTGVYAADKYGSQLHLHTTNNTYGLFAGSWNLNDAVITCGAHFYSGGNWRARATSASGIEFSTSVLSIYTNSGLTPGTTYTPTKRLLVDPSGITLGKTSGVGIKVDTASPTFPWRDIIGRVTSVNQGASKPTQVTYRDTILEFQFAAGDEDYFQFHIPHDYVPGTDIHLHFHWSHTGTLVNGGTVTFEYEATYAASHNQAAFPASVSGTVAGTASTTQYQHILSEVQLSAASPSGSQLDSDDLEPDGLILMRAGLSANNITVSGGGVPDPFIHFVDIHYQSMNIGTKSKAPDFYT